MGRFVDVLLAEFPDARASLGPRVDEAERLLEAHLSAGQAAWPDLHVVPEAFVRFLGRRVAAASHPFDDLAGLPAADLYLACACADGNSRAVAIFEARYFPNVDAVVVAMRAPSSAADDVKQILRARFFMATADRPAAITEFAGRGNLHGWVRVSAVRELLRLFKKERRKVDLDEALLEEIAPAPDPETAAVKAKCKTELAGAFREALAALPPRERTLLRYQVADGLSIDAIGAIYRVHRATVARWLATIRDDLVADTQRRLAARLRLDRDEVESVIRLVRSQLDLSIVRLLDEEPQS